MGSQASLDLSHEIAAVLKVWSGPWIIWGDFNRTPDELLCTGPKTATCNNRTIGDFVVSKDFAHAVHGVHAVGDTGNAPHSAVRLLLSSRPRQDTMRILKDIPNILVTLPRAPMTEDHFSAAPESAT